MTTDPHPTARALREMARQRGVLPRDATQEPQTARGAAPVFPMVIPWALVIHDNHRFVPARGRLVAAPKYRAAKRHAAEFLLGAWGLREKMTGDIVLHAQCWFPDKRKRDAGNYRKMITDALTGLVYADDSQLVSETWERAGFDKVCPRIEITLRAPVAHRAPRPR